VIRSMTGYGQARREGDGFVVLVELRSVNGRYFRLNSRVPNELAAAERGFEKRIRERVTRGSVDLYVKVELTGARAARPVNTAALASYLRQLRDVGDKLGCPIALTPEALAVLPGVLEGEEIADGEAEALVAEVDKALGAALDAIDAMRRAEGASLRDELLRHCDAVEAIVAEVATSAPEGVQHYKGRLRERVDRLLQDTGIAVSEQDLAREIAIYADRSSVCEEVARLRSHAEQFREALAQAEPVGRRLEFLAQEMHREVNTMGSKVADAALSRQMVDLHGAVDKIREQVLNVE